MDDYRTVLAQNIRKIRLEKGISQEKLAGLAGIDRTYMQSIEYGKRNISVDVLLKLCHALKTSPNEMLGNFHSLWTT